MFLTLNKMQEIFEEFGDYGTPNGIYLITRENERTR